MENICSLLVCLSISRFVPKVFALKSRRRRKPLENRHFWVHVSAVYYLPITNRRSRYCQFLVACMSVRMHFAIGHTMAPSLCAPLTRWRINDEAVCDDASVHIDV